MRRLVLFSDMYFGSPTLERSRFSCARLPRPNLRRRLGEWAGMAGACAGARDVVVGWRGFFWSALRPVCGVPSQSDGFFLCPVVLKHTRLMDRIPRKVLLANLGPVRRFEVGPRAVVQGVNKFLPSTVTLLVPWKRGEIQVRIFFTIFRVQPPTTHDRGIFTYPGWNQWNEISAHLWTKLRHVRYMFSWHERTQIHMYMTECPTSLRMMSQGSRAYN